MNLSIKYKFILFFTAILIAIMTFVFLYFPAQMKKEVLRTTAKRTNELAKIFSQSTGVAIGGGVFELLINMVDIAKKDESLEYFAILDDVGDEIVKYNLDNLDVLRAVDTKDGRFEYNNFINVASPVIYENEFLGTLYIGHSTNEVTEKITSMRWFTFFISIIILLVGITITIFLVNRIIRPIFRIDQGIERLSQNDLSFKVQVTSRDEIGVMGQSFNQTVGNLAGVIRQIAKSSSSIGNASDQISSALEQFAAGAEEQQLQLSEVVTSMEQMSVMILESSKNASQTQENTNTANEAATGGRRSVNEVVSGIEGIASIVESAARQISALESRSKEIGEVIQVIDDIADQTNLLALNANIEAARAGEAGRGFAIVADEVRKLAERTVNATAEIGGKIKLIQGDVGSSVSAMNTITEQTKENQVQAAQSGQALEEIVSAIEYVKQAVSQIAGAANEQISVVEQISQNVETVSTVAKKAANGAQDLASSAEQLNNEVSSLNGLVGQFKV